jgi:hypothetical protein
MSQEVLLMVYCPYFHSIVSYGKIFWAASPHSINIFRLQNNNKIITNIRKKELRRKLSCTLKA